MKLNVVRTGTAFVLMMLAVTAAGGDFREYMRAGEQQFRGPVADRDYDAARGAAIEARKIAETADERSRATLLLGRALAALGEEEAARAEYDRVLSDTEAGLERKADAHMGIAEMLSGAEEWDAARAELEKVFALDVSVRTKNNAQREILQIWASEGDAEGLKAAVEDLAEGDDEAWPGRKANALNQAGFILRSRVFGDHAGARRSYEQILALPDAGTADIIGALRNIAVTHRAEEDRDAARAALNKALAVDEMPDRDKLAVLRDIARMHIEDSSYDEARGFLAEALAVALIEHLDHGRPANYVSILREMAGTYAEEENHSSALEALEKALAAAEGLSAVIRADVLNELAAANNADGDLTGALKAVGQILELEGIRINDYRHARGNVLDALRIARTGDEKQETSILLERVLGTLADHEETEPDERLTLLLQSAGTYGLRGDFKAMEKKIDETLGRAKDEGELVAHMESLWDAAVFYVNIREHEVGSALTDRKVALRESAWKQNTYTCGFISSAPIGVGGWAQSDFVKSAKNRESRFRPYPSRGEGYALISDVATARPIGEEGEVEEGRPLDEVEKSAHIGRGTSFFMVYDDKGWHIYVQTDEPEIEKVMVDGGRGSSLEMFFSPGLERVTYYQWILRLATGDVNLYHWHSPHKFYRHLRHEPDSFQVETAALEKGWGTAIFIPWECLYDKLPFMAGNDDTWRFSIMRWGPVRVTWGGRVHETGRWGLVNWEAPTAGQRTAILRRLVRRAWRRYNSAKNGIVDFWNCPRRGDPEFYEARVKPLIEKQDGFREQMETVQEWDGKTVEDVFINVVPVWMELDYEVATLRENYLLEKFVP